MRIPRRMVVIATTAVMVVALVSALPVAAASDKQIREAEHFRSTNGLKASDAVVEASFADQETYSDTGFGIPLTPAEAAEMDRRGAIVRQLEPAKDVARSRAGYSDLYIDQQNGGIPVFLFTGDIAAHRAAIDEVMPDSIDFEVKRVEYTLKELRAKQDQITDDMLASDWVLGGDIPIEGVGYKVQWNLVTVGLTRASDETRARSILQDRYGPMVDVQFIGPSQNDATSATAPIDPSKLALRFGGGDSRLNRPLGYSWERVPRGSWTVEGGRQRPDGRLVLDLRIDPPGVGLPLDRGPATLFASISLSGDAGGDVGAGARVGRPTHVRMKRCRQEDACEYRARVVLPADRLGSRAVRTAGAEAWHALNVKLVLVRSFDQGTWMQVLPLGARVRNGPAGTLAKFRRSTGSIRYQGLFPVAQGEAWLAAEPPEVQDIPTLEIAERLRRRGSDDSAISTTVPLHLELDAGDCEGWTLTSRIGDVVLDETELISGRQVHDVEVPAGSTWFVRSPSFANAYGNEPEVTIQTFGPFTAEDAPVALSGSWSCADSTGSVELVPGSPGPGPEVSPGDLDR